MLYLLYHIVLHKSLLSNTKKTMVLWLETCGLATQVDWVYALVSSKVPQVATPRADGVQITIILFLTFAIVAKQVETFEV